MHVHPRVIPSLLLTLLLLVACARQTTPPAAIATVPIALATPVLPAPTPAAPATMEPTAPAAATASPLVAPSPTGEAPATASAPEELSLQGYLDDRSSGAALMRSYVDALNRHEYARAYGYWENADSAPAVGPFEPFAAGYASTASIDLTLGTISGDAGAGQMYYSVPVFFQSHVTDGTTQPYAGCYVLHLAQPGVQGEPPFRGLAIQRAVVQSVAADRSAEEVLPGACTEAGLPVGQPLPDEPVPAPDDISATRYLDDRSGPVEVLRSLFNAINRHEYVRAYSYWQAPASTPELPPFEQFQDGYQSTDSVTLTTGPVTSGAGAGQLYWEVPVTLEVLTTQGEAQRFVGCYTLHLAQPALQASPPFQPLGIQSATVEQLPADADTAALMAQACPAR